MGFDSRPDTYAHIQQVQGNLAAVITNLLKRSLEHDRSKLESPEVEIFDEFTPKLKDSTYGSDEYKGFLKDMGKALEHHYAHNSHHPEHYYGLGISGMSLLDLIEMLCDWEAASRRHADGDIRKSLPQNQERFGYSDELQQILLNTLDEVGL